jgi:large subunit ribosomal protein L25
MQTVELKAAIREQFGKSAVKKIRQKALIPAMVHQGQKKPIAVEFNYREFERLLQTRAGSNVVINLLVRGKEKSDRTVIIEEIQFDPVTDHMRHVDLKAISLTEKIKVHVPLTVTGQSLGVMEGGVLDIVRHEIEVECLPTKIPEKIEVDITALQIGDVLHISDIRFPAEVSCVLPPEDVVISIHAQKAEEAPAEEAQAAEPEVIAKGKEEGEAAEGEEAAKPAKAAAKPEAKKPEAKKEEGK